MDQPSSSSACPTSQSKSSSSSESSETSCGFCGFCSTCKSNCSPGEYERGFSTRRKHTTSTFENMRWPRKNVWKLSSFLSIFLLLFCVRTALCDIDESSSENALKQHLQISDSGSGQSDSNNANFACNEVRYYYNALSEAKGFTAINTKAIPPNAVSGDHLKVCAQGFTCCTMDMESQLSEESEKDYQRVLQDKMIGLRHTFESRTSKFDRFFRELLANSRTDLHSMFLQTYGQIYSQHSEIFIKLFDNLTDYYTRGTLDLNESLDGFYKSLYRRMFKIMNPHFQFSESYWRCMEPMMGELKPFGDVPQKMKQQVIRSFVAARTFAQAMAKGRDSIRKVMEMAPGNQCSSALMRMMYCPHCRGLPGLKPCNNFCLNVMKGCLAHQADLDPDWNAYVEMLLQLLDRIEGPFNVESVIDGIDVKISEAIMIFQENGPSVSQQVFAGCGTPDAEGRKRRGAGPRRREEFSIEELRYGAHMHSDNPRPTTAAGTNLERLSRDIREKIRPTKGFWKNLPYNLCNDNQVAAPAKRDTDCWNGVTRDRYQASLVGDGVMNQGDNPEVSLDGSPNAQIGEVIMALRMATNQMRRAYNGRDVSWDHADSARSDKQEAIAGDSDDIEEFSGSGDGESDLEPVPETTKESVPIDTDDEDLVRHQPNLHNTDPEQKTGKYSSTNIPTVPESDTEDGSGSGDFEDMEVDWRGTHRESEWERERSRKPAAPPKSAERPKFVQPPIRFDTDSPEEAKTPGPAFDSDFEIGIKAENPPGKDGSRLRSLAVAWYLLVGLVLSFVVRW